MELQGWWTCLAALLVWLVLAVLRGSKRSNSPTQNVCDQQESTAGAKKVQQKDKKEPKKPSSSKKKKRVENKEENRESALSKVESILSSFHISKPGEKSQDCVENYGRESPSWLILQFLKPSDIFACFDASPWFWRDIVWRVDAQQQTFSQDTCSLLDTLTTSLSQVSPTCSMRATARGNRRGTRKELESERLLDAVIAAVYMCERLGRPDYSLKILQLGEHERSFSESKETEERERMFAKAYAHVMKSLARLGWPSEAQSLCKRRVRDHHVEPGTFSEVCYQLLVSEWRHSRPQAVPFAPLSSSLGFAPPLALEKGLQRSEKEAALKEVADTFEYFVCQSAWVGLGQEGFFSNAAVVVAAFLQAQSNALQGLSLSQRLPTVSNLITASQTCTISSVDPNHQPVSITTQRNSSNSSPKNNNKNKSSKNSNKKQGFNNHVDITRKPRRDRQGTAPELANPSLRSSSRRHRRHSDFKHEPPQNQQNMKQVSTNNNSSWTAEHSTKPQTRLRRNSYHRQQKKRQQHQQQQRAFQHQPHVNPWEPRTVTAAPMPTEHPVNLPPAVFDFGPLPAARTPKKNDWEFDRWPLMPDFMERAQVAGGDMPLPSVRARQNWSPVVVSRESFHADSLADSLDAFETFDGVDSPPFLMSPATSVSSESSGETANRRKRLQVEDVEEPFPEAAVDLSFLN